MRKNSVKNTRINAEVQRALSEIIREGLKDPRIHELTSCTGLKQAAGFIRHELAEKINLRNTPELKFVLDTSMAYGMKMSKLIDEVMGNESTKE